VKTYRGRNPDHEPLPPDSRPIRDFADARRNLQGYAVRADGSVLFFSTSRKKWLVLKTKTGPGGFIKVRLKIEGRAREIGVAHLVLSAWTGPRPTGFEPIHYPDANPANNRLENLRWAPRGSSKLGRLCSGSPPPAPYGDSHPHAILTEADIPEIRRLYRDGLGYTEIADMMDMSEEAVRHVLVGKTWAHVPDPGGPIIMRAKGPSSEESPLAKLDWDLVREIRARLKDGRTCREVVEDLQLPVSICAIRDIWKNRTWKQAP
jgi:hypothetical protein